MASFVSIGKSKQFYEFLRNSLLDGEYQVGDKFPSIRELSKKYEISKPTVNSVISNLVNEGFLVVDQGRGTFVARVDEQKNSEKTNLIGVLMSNYTNSSFESAVLGYLGDLFQKKGYYIIPVNSYGDYARFYSMLSMLVTLEVSGLVVVPPSEGNFDINVVRSLTGQIPIVCVNRDLPGCNRDFVQMDFHQSGRLAMENLLVQGKTRIILQHFKDAFMYETFLSGCVEACNEAGKKPEDTIIVSGLSDLADIIQKADGLIADDEEIYRSFSVICDSQMQMGRKIGIVSINHSEYSRLSSQEVTLIRNSNDLIADECCELLIDRINGFREYRSTKIPYKICNQK